MKTQITDLFNIKYPILLSGMTGISSPELVAAVSNAGGLGILATGDLDIENMKKTILKVRELTDKPFGANVPFLIPGSAEKAQVLIEEKVDIINYSLGKGEQLTKDVHKYGGKVIATVINHKHAMSAQKTGADALIVTGHEAAAHGGDVTSLVLVPNIVDAVNIPVIAAGGFADGRGLAAAISLGAEGIAMGSRFMNTVESPAHKNLKTESIKKDIYDTVFSDRIDGIYCRALKTKGSLKLINDKLYLPKAIFNSRLAAKRFGIPWFKIALGILLSGFNKTNHLVVCRVRHTTRCFTGLQGSQSL
jgi:enoyl-[acyl-carrier protein] reductase II